MEGKQKQVYHHGGIVCMEIEDLIGCAVSDMQQPAWKY